MFKRIIMITIVVVVPALAEPATKPATPIDQIIERVPSSLAGEAVKSYDIIAIAGDTKSPIIARARKTLGGHYSLYVTCANRHVPLLYLVDHEAVQYDPALGVLRRFHNSDVEVMVASKNDALSASFDLHFYEKPATKPAEPIQANLNFRSLLEPTNHNVTVKPVGDYQLITGHTARGNVGEFWIDPRRKDPLAAMALYSGNKPFFTFSRIETDMPVDESNLTFPSDQELSGVLPLKEIDGTFSTVAWQAGLMLSMMYELAIEDPQRRPAIEAKLGKIDWDKRIAADAEVNRRLINLIGEQIPTDGRSK